MTFKSAVILSCIVLSAPGTIDCQILSRADSLRERMRREEYYGRIDRKLRLDLDATRVMVIPVDARAFPAKEIRTSDGAVINLSDGGNSQLLYLVNEETTALSSGVEVIPLALRRQSVSESDSNIGLGLGRAQIGGRAFTVVVRFKDIVRLDEVQQRQIVDYIVANTSKTRRELKLQTESDITQSVFPHQRDFWSFSKATSRYPVPAIDGESSVVGIPSFLHAGSISLGGGARMDTTTRHVNPFVTKSPAEIHSGSNASERRAYALDFSVSRIAFTHEILFAEQALGIPGFGVEVGIDDPVLSLLAYQAPAVSWGGRLLLSPTGKKEDLLDKDFVDLKLLVKSRFNARRFYEDVGALKYPLTPLVSSERPTLNIAVPGFCFEISTSKWWNLPHMTFYFSRGSDEYADPVSLLGSPGDPYAYWSTTQWRGSMSFYFNLDSDPEFYAVDASGKRLNIVRLDIGAGTYNIHRVWYDGAGSIRSREPIVKASRVQPYLAAEYAHSSQVKTGFGASLAYFDNRVTVKLWISLFKIGPHALRLEGTDIIGPFGRSRYEWEVPGSAQMQFRYRLGF